VGANLYGVSNPAPLLFYTTLISGANTNCPAGTETNLLQTPLIIAPSSGAFYPVAWVNLTVTVGGTSPTLVTLGHRINGGADLGTFNVNTSLFVAGATVTFTWYAIGPASRTLWVAPGSQYQISLNPTAQAVTAIYSFCQGSMGVLRAADI
jgi:hypothetical protein